MRPGASPPPGSLPERQLSRREKVAVSATSRPLSELFESGLMLRDRVRSVEEGRTSLCRRMRPGASPPPGSLLERQLLRREKVAVFATPDERSDFGQRQPNDSDVLCTFNVDAVYAPLH
jgi:hypothetical protein